MSMSESILSEFLTKEELAAELRRNAHARPLRCDRVRTAADACWTEGALSARERPEMARGARASAEAVMSAPDVTGPQQTEGNDEPPLQMTLFAPQERGL